MAGALRGGVLAHTLSCHDLPANALVAATPLPAPPPLLAPPPGPPPARAKRACARAAVLSYAVVSIVPLHSGRAPMATFCRACTR